MQEPNSEILIYQNPEGNIKIDVRLEEETVWLSQAQLAVLFGKSRNTITEHIQNIFKERELKEDSVCRNYRHTASDGKTYDTNYYNLDVIISVGYRVKSLQGTQFRIWATQRLKEYIVKGFALNDDRFKSGNSMNYFSELQERIREIRISERFFYQKIKDIYTTSIDYDPKDEKTIAFFKIVQNKLLWAISQQTGINGTRHHLFRLGNGPGNGIYRKWISLFSLVIQKENPIIILSLLVPGINCILYLKFFLLFHSI